VTITQDVAAKRPANTEPVLASPPRGQQQHARTQRHQFINDGQSGGVVLVLLLSLLSLAGLLGVAANLLTT
jgi:hypothetical protein